MYEGFNLKVTGYVLDALQPEGATVSFTSGDRGLQASVVSDVTVTAQAAFINIKKMCVAVVHLAKSGWFYCTGRGESHTLRLGGYAELTMR